MSPNSTQHYDVIILGAGAGGLMCALTAGQRGRSVLVLEKSNKIGKKILMSGGGRCNFTNHFIESDNFLSNNPHFCKAALTRYTQWDFINLVEKYEIDYEERKHSQLFCLDSAKDIQRMLIDECEKSGVIIHTHCEINSVNDVAVDDQHQYRVTTKIQDDLTQLSGHSLVVATGALSIPSLGGSSMGYDIAQKFGLTITEKRAGLVPVMFSGTTKPICERLSGLSLEVEVTCRQQTFKEDLLFTHRGMSGPCILQISNFKLLVSW